jgi:hypothetical protein
MGAAADSAGDVNGDGYDDVIVGTERFDNTKLDEGRAAVYLGGPAGLASDPVWTVYGGQAGCELGWWAGSAGDVNGDGYDDVLVSAWHFDSTSPDGDEGRVWVYHGSATGPESEPSWTKSGEQAGSAFGSAARNAGDVNGDGYDDIIVAAHEYDGPEDNEGRVYVFLGSVNGLSETAAWTWESNQAGARLGHWLGLDGAGDVNGDGYDDVIVGAPEFDGPDVDEGRAWVFLGGTDGPADSPVATLEMDQAGAWFGSRCGRAGDVNGDGYDDLVVGARLYDHAWDDEGGAFVFHGDATGVEPAAAWNMFGGQAEAQFARNADALGDLDGDGFEDLIVCALAYDRTRTDEGRTWVFRGSVDGLSEEANWSSSGRLTDELFGCVCTAAGDVNGDGATDVLVGAGYHDGDYPDEGRALVYYGPLPEDTDCPR